MEWYFFVELLSACWFFTHCFGDHIYCSRPSKIRADVFSVRNCSVHRLSWFCWIIGSSLERSFVASIVIHDWFLVQKDACCTVSFADTPRRAYPATRSNFTIVPVCCCARYSLSPQQGSHSCFPPTFSESLVSPCSVFLLFGVSFLLKRVSIAFILLDSHIISFSLFLSPS